MFKNIFLTTVVGAVLIVGVAHADVAVPTTVELQAQIKELLAKVAELTRQLDISRGRDGVVQETPPYRHRICLLPMRTLAEGQRGDEVRALQEFLQSERTFTSTPTGFFGPLTREALKQWQAGQGIDPAGVVGPRTAERLRIWCGEWNLPGQSLNANPTRGDAPLAVSFTARSEADFSPTKYQIDFGDGTKADMQRFAGICQIGVDGPCNGGDDLRASHTYTANGTYTATLYRITNPCGEGTMCLAPVQMQIVGKVQIFVGPVTNRPPTISEFSGPTTLAENVSGTWTIKATDPENGTLSYAIHWGDDSLMRESAAMTRGTSFVQTTSLTHTYTTAGTYTVTVIVTDSDGQDAQATITVKVSRSIY